jgi:low temperature requirement protein LtrA
VDGGVIAAAVLGTAAAAAIWWLYFDVSALAAAQRLAEIQSVKERNELARDGFSYLHLPMVAAIVLGALGFKSVLAHVGDPLEWEVATALVRGTIVYLLAHVAFKRRSLGTVAVPRLVAAGALVPVIPLAHQVDAIVTLATVSLVLWTLVAFEFRHYAAARRQIREAEHARHHPHQEPSGA